MKLIRLIKNLKKKKSESLSQNKKNYISPVGSEVLDPL